MPPDSNPGSPPQSAPDAAAGRLPEPRRALDWILVAFAAVALATLVFGPTASSWSDHFIGDGGVDALGTQWFYWLIGRRVLDGEPFAHTDLLFYPWGKDVYLHTGGNVLDAALALPFRFLLGPTVGYDVYVVALLAANGVAAGWLAHRLGARPLGAGLAAVLFAVNPFVLGEVAGGRPTQALLSFTCLFVAAWLRVLNDGGDRWSVRRAAVAAGLWLGLSGLAYWFYAIFGLLLGAVAVCIRLARPAPEVGRVALLSRLGLSGVVAAAVALPLAWPMLAALGQGEVPGLLDVHAWTLGTWSPTTVEGWEVGVEAFDFLSGRVGFHADLGAGPTFLPGGTGAFFVEGVLLAIGLLVAPRRLRILLGAMALAGLLLAVGPSLDHRSGLTNPAYVIATWVVPPLRRLWWPSRALGLVHVILVPLLAFAIDRLAGTGRLRRVVLALLVVVATGLELKSAELAPLPTSSSDVPPAYACLAREHGAILEIPYSGRAEQLHYQVVHGRPRFGGMLEDNPVFAPAEHVAFRDSNALVQAIFAAADGVTVNPLPTDADREAVHALGIDYVVVESQHIGARTDERGRLGAQRRARRALADLLGQPVFADHETLVFAPWGAPWDCPGL